ncbi:MAG: hypothetical protein EXR07_06340 [Acetobacteraceae bacterium]|nr:hypothetical protein [Acetobacteraceae bacterium]
MRFAEIALLGLPLLVFVAWRVMAPTGGPPRVLVIGVAGAVAAMAVLLLILRYEDASPPEAGYVPARQEEGRIVPPHVEIIVPPHVEPIAPPPGASPR